MADSLDMDNRDPNNLNDHVKVCFEDVLAEPEGAHSINCVWSLSYSCFTGWRNCCYAMYSVLYGCPLAMCWGCEFAEITFQHVWQITPCLRIWMINLGCAQKFFGTCVNCCLAPICEAGGMFFNNVRVKNT
ncbi:caveolin-1-like isoform X2 [Haliotis rufescens]|uniref:caveolin-1-like isoform X2 n=1 Tax=Haliotis rufescens TaxID=6454 RepID=UPI001EAF9A69|nr:caveolin-1-like isoform X2 [Haliotis rufescens]